MPTTLLPSGPARLALLTCFLLSAAERPLAAGEPVIEAAYTADLLQNVSGGLRRGGSVLQNVDLAINLDLETVVNGMPGTLFTYLLWNDDTTFSDRYVGDFQVLSNIDTEQALRLYEFWYETHLSPAVSLRVGLYDLNSEFDAIDSSRLFLNSSHGIGAEFAQSGQNGPSIFPVTSLAARLHWDISDSTTVRYALLDGVPGNPDRPHETTVRLGGADGFLHALEVDYRSADRLRVGIGAWQYSARFDHLQAADGDNRSSAANRGFYVFSDAMLAGGSGGEARIDLFLRYGVANGDMNTLDRYSGAGVLVSNIFKSRPDDSFGLAVTHAHAGTPWFENNDATARHESSIEITYSAILSDWVRIQPNVQYIRNPSFGLSAHRALAIGMRVEFSWSGSLPDTLSR